MRNQQFLLLSLLGLGILAFPQIAAVSYDEDESNDIFHRNDSNAEVDECLESFYNAMLNATEESQNEDGVDPSTVKQLTQEFSDCILKIESATDKPQKNPGASKVQKIRNSQYQSRTHHMGKMKNDISGEAVDQIEDFEYEPDYDDLSKQLVGQLHEELKKFIQAGLDQEYRQENYVNLVKKMLYAVSATILSEDLFPGVNAVIDIRLEPYILGVLTEQSHQLSRMVYRKFKKSRITKLRTGQLSAPPDCDSEEFEPTIKCVYSYVVGLVELERSHTPDTDADQIWEPFGTKLLQNLERLLIKIIEQTPSRRYAQRYTFPALVKIFKERSSVVSCLDMLREKYDVENLGIVMSGAESEAISKCFTSAIKRGQAVIKYFTLLRDIIRIDSDYYWSLHEYDTNEITEKVMRFYPTLKDLRYFVRRQIKGDGQEVERVTHRGCKTPFCDTFQWEAWSKSGVPSKLAETDHGRYVGPSDLLGAPSRGSIDYGVGASQGRIVIGRCFLPGSDHHKLPVHCAPGTVDLHTCQRNRKKFATGFRYDQTDTGRVAQEANTPGGIIREINGGKGFSGKFLLDEVTIVSREYGFRTQPM